MTKWAFDEMVEELKTRGWYKEHRDIPHGKHVTLNDDTPIDWYESGSVVVRGKDTPLKIEALALFEGEKATGTISPTAPSVVTKRVFIVYGHDEASRNELELIIRRLKLEPVILAGC